MIATRSNKQTKSAGFTGYRFTVDQYHRMIDAGILTEDDPVELLEGWIVVKPDYVSRHATPRIQLTNATNGWTLHRFTLDQYHRMIDAGILTEDDQVELLEEWIVKKTAKNPPHRTTVTRLSRWGYRCLDEKKWTVNAQDPITLLDSEPEPDLSIARGPDTLYLSRHPGPLDVAMAIEVPDTTLVADRLKCAVYAAVKIPQYWIVNLVEGVIEVYTKPQAGKKPTYRSVKKYDKNDTISLVLDGKIYGEIPVKQLLS
jgi:hypothetical protein